MKRDRRMLVAAAVVVLAIAGGGAAIAATGGGDPKAESEAALADAAGQLGVTPAKLTDALQEALKNRVDAAVEAGRLTEAQAQELKQRIDSGEVPLLGMGPRHGHHRGPGPGLDAAASFLGVTQAQLRESLHGGATLAELAKEKGKSVDGLVDAMVAAAKERIAADVESGRLTQAQADEILGGVEERMRALVNGEHPARGERFGGPGPRGFGSGGPEPFSDSAPA